MKTIQASDSNSKGGYGTDVTGNSGNEDSTIRALHTEEINKDLLAAINNSGLLTGETYDSMLKIGERVHFFTNGQEQFNFYMTWNGQAYTAVKQSPSVNVTTVVIIYGTNIQEEITAGTVVATLYAIGDTNVVFAELQDLGDYFSITANEILTAGSVPEGTYEYVFSATGDNSTYQDRINIVINANAILTSIYLSNFKIASDAILNELVGALTTKGGDTATLSITSQTKDDVGVTAFTIDGSDNLDVVGISADEGDTYEVTIQADDGTTIITQDFIIEVTAAIFSNDSCYYFNGTDEEIIVAYDAEMQNIATTASWSAWIRPDPTASTGTSMIVQRWDTNVNWTWRYINTTNYLQFYVSDGAGSDNLITYGVTKGEWNFVTTTFDSGQLDVYINGVWINGKAMSESTCNTSDTSRMEIGSSGAAQFFHGHMDELTIFDVALTQTEITRLYNSGVPTRIMADDLSVSVHAHYRLGDSISGITEPDEGPHNLDGVLTNMDSTNISRNVPFDWTHANPYGLIYNGADERMETATDVAGMNGTSMSISFWIKKTSSVGTKYVTGRYGNTNQRSFAIAIAGNAGGLTYLTSVDGSAVVSDSTATGLITMGAWEHVVVTYDLAASKIYTYIAGALVDTITTAQTAIFAATTEPITIGVLRTAAATYSGYIDASIDEICFFNTTLSLLDVEDLYAKGAASSPLLAPCSADMAAYWTQGDDFDGTTDGDQVGSADMTATAMALANRTTGV